MTIANVIPRRVTPGAGVDPETRKIISDLQDAVADAFRRLRATSVESDAIAISSGETPLPQLVWITASQAIVQGWAGLGSVVRRTLQDGIQRSFDGFLAWDITASGVGGRDTGSESASTWYYLYLVPHPGAPTTSLGLVSSTVPPISGGPAGYSSYAYVGALYNDGSSNLRKIYHVSPSHFAWYYGITPASVAAFGTAFKDPAVTASLVDVIPDTAACAHLNFEIQRDGSAGGWDVSLNLRIDGETNVFTEVFANNLAFNSQYLYTWIPTPTSPKQIGYRSYKTGGTPAIALQDVSCLGWIDGFLVAQAGA